jgi:ABC-type Fe3+-hydroxamate transport system substrate-binding protein
VRIISLVPSATETLISWGITPIGVSRFCEQPGLPSFGGTKDPAVEQIVDGAPDLVVMCDQENRIEDHDALVAEGVSVFVFSITALHQVDAELARLRDAIGMPPLVSSAGAGASVQSLDAWVPIWKRPWMTVSADTYASSLLAAAGFHNVFGDSVSRYPEVGLADVIARKPAVVLAPSEPYPFAERHRQLLEQVGPTRFVDGRDLFWWGSRTEGALIRLQQLRQSLN